MKDCERCGSEIIDGEYLEYFKCPKCKDIKIEKNLLEPLVKIVRKNFRELKAEFKFLANLYTCGSYTDESLKSSYIYLVMILNKDLLGEFIDDELQYQREEIWDEFGLEEDFDAVVKYLNTDAFFDFRKCQEYPDGCLDCSEQEGCTYDVKYWSERPNYCLSECKHARLPSCMNLHDLFCSWHENWELDESKRLLLEELMDQVKNGADKTFNILNLDVKVIRLSYYNSIDEFCQLNEIPNLELRLLE